MGDSEGQPSQPPQGSFPPTHWSLVAEAGRDSSPDARQAFGDLYSAYSAPLLAFLRGVGKSVSEAEDLLQGFFEFLLEHRGLSKVKREGKFRSWLLKSLKHYVADVWDKETAIKRGGGRPHVVLDPGAEEEAAVQPRHPGRTPDEEYDRQFALRFLELVRERLEREHAAAGKTTLFQRLQPFLLNKKGILSHADLGASLKMSEANVSKAISRLRQRYRAVFDEELKKLVGLDGEIEEEKQFLFRALSK
jgi:DNA-directed RNA polymerase specialized sigma24 family protein